MILVVLSLDLVSDRYKMTTKSTLPVITISNYPEKHNLGQLKGFMEEITAHAISDLTFKSLFHRTGGFPVKVDPISHF